MSNSRGPMNMSYQGGFQQQRNQQQNLLTNLSNQQMQQHLTNQSTDSVQQNPMDPDKVMRYLFRDKTNNQNQQSHQQQQQQLNVNQSQTFQRSPLLKEKQQRTFTNGNDENYNNYSLSKSRSALDLENTYPIAQQQAMSNEKQPKFDVSKSMGVLSPKSLIKSCLTFNGNEGSEMNFLNQAMQPDKIFDLPMALVKVQTAFQSSNQNVMKLKESLEIILQREQQLQDKYDRLKREKQIQQVNYEEEIVKLKQQQKDQLFQLTIAIQSDQQKIKERDIAISKFKAQLNMIQDGNGNLLGQLEMQSGEVKSLQEQLMRKQKELDGLKRQFQVLLQQEEESSKQLDLYQGQNQREMGQLRSIVEERNLFIDVLQKDLDCLRQEKKLWQDSEEQLNHEIQKIKNNSKNDNQKVYIEHLEFKRAKEQEVDTLNKELFASNRQFKDLQKRYEKSQASQEKQEAELQIMRQQLGKVSSESRGMLVEQRQQFEQKMKEMEEEVNKISLSRYKNELDQKQNFLKTTKRYDEQIRELRQVVGYIFNTLDIKHIPDYLKEDLASSICEIRIGKDLSRSLEEFDSKLSSLKQVSSQQRGAENAASAKQHQQQYEQLMKAYRTELMLRRGLHDQLQELKGNIRVLCRIRPPLSHERKKKQSVKIISEHMLMIQNETGTKDQKFEFDRIFEQSESQEEISEEVQQLVTSSLDGFNVCIMAYGQTGSGKTYTMIGSDNYPGLYFSSVEQLFAKINERKSVVKYEVTASFVEIYNEQLRDLLSKKGQVAGQAIKIRENKEGETTSDQILRVVKSKNQVLQCLQEACQNRTVGTTHYNEQSSRSHFVFTLHLVGRHRDTKQVFRGKLNLIDLAGSERILKSHAEGDRVKEALNINQSLTTLGKVFLSLLNKTSHVPYRDSKLTHYLKDSLGGGHSKAMLIVQVSPSPVDYAESLGSLNFGQRVSYIEKGQVRATIESPTKQQQNGTKRSKSNSQRQQLAATDYSQRTYNNVTSQNSYDSSTP